MRTIHKIHGNFVLWGFLVISMLLMVCSCSRPEPNRVTAMGKDDVEVIGKLSFLKGWSISDKEKELEWTRVVGGPIEKLSPKHDNGKWVRLIGKWQFPTKSLNELPPGDQGADPEVWRHIKVKKLEFIDTKDVQEIKNP